MRAFFLGGGLASALPLLAAQPRQRPARQFTRGRRGHVCEQNVDCSPAEHLVTVRSEHIVDSASRLYIGWVLYEQERNVVAFERERAEDVDLCAFHLCACGRVRFVQIRQGASASASTGEQARCSFISEVRQVGSANPKGRRGSRRRLGSRRARGNQSAVANRAWRGSLQWSSTTSCARRSC